MSLPWFAVTVFSSFAYLLAIVNSSVDITLSVFVAIEMRAEVYGNQDSQSFSFALSKSINAQTQCQLNVDSFLTVTFKCERRAWRYTSYSTGSTHNYSPRTRDHPTGIALIPPSPAVGIGYTGNTHVLEFGSVDCVASFLMACAQCVGQWKPFDKHWHGNQSELTACTDIDLVINRDID